MLIIFKGTHYLKVCNFFFCISKVKHNEFKNKHLTLLKIPKLPKFNIITNEKYSSLQRADILKLPPPSPGRTWLCEFLYVAQDI